MGENHGMERFEALKLGSQESVKFFLLKNRLTFRQIFALQVRKELLKKANDDCKNALNI